MTLSSDTAPGAAGTAAALESTLSRRLEALERDNQRLRRSSQYVVVGMGVLLGLTAAIMVIAARHGMPGMVPEVSEARKFLLRDGEGRIRGIWGMNSDGSAQLVLQDSLGHGRLRFSVLPDGSTGVAFADTGNQARAVLGVLPDQSVTLVLADQGGKTRTVLGLAPNGSSTIVFADKSGTTRAGLGVDAHGIGTFTLLDRTNSDLTGSSGDEQTEPQATDSPPVNNGAPGRR